MARVTRDEMLMEVAQAVAKRGTCSRLQVGAVISREGRIISTGYNGAPAGLDHCYHTQEQPYAYLLDGPMDEPIDARPGRMFLVPESVRTITPIGCQVAEHAERNAIAFAARYGLALDRGELHCTHAPCLQCSRSIINAGITRVSYLVPYRLTEGVELLAHAGLDVVDMSLPEKV